jgi:hypothetical protein
VESIRASDGLSFVCRNVEIHLRKGVAQVTEDRNGRVQSEALRGTADGEADVVHQDTEGGDEPVV